MNDDRLDQLIRSSLEWQAEHDARRAPSLGTSARQVAERLGQQRISSAPSVLLRPGPARSLPVLLTVVLLALLAVAAAIFVGSRQREPTLPTGLTGALTMARSSGHAAVGLADGRVLVVGGRQSSHPIGLAELWDPGTGTFTPAGVLDPARNHATATRLRDGRVLVVGGFAGQYEYRANAVATANLWDPATLSFTETGSLGTARAGHAATLLADGRVMVTGGGPTEVWDPDTGAFRQLGPAVAGAVVPLEDGRILVVNGVSAEILGEGRANPSQAGPLLAARTDYSATLLRDGRVLVVGGRARNAPSETGGITDDGFQIVAARDSPSRLASAELWDPVTGRFTAAGAMARGRIGHTATLLPDGRVLILGGQGIVDVVGRRGYRDFPGAEVWDPVTRTFGAAPPLIEPRAGHSAVPLAGGRVLVLGGTGPGTPDQPLRFVEIYDPKRTIPIASPP